MRQLVAVAGATGVSALMLASSVVVAAVWPGAGTNGAHRAAVPEQGGVPEPAAIAGQGYRRVFHDEFGRLHQCAAGCRWSRRLWYKSHPPARSQYVRGSVLHLVSRRSQGFPGIAISTLSDNGRAGRSFRRGYFEARMRWTGGKGAWPAFWLLSTANARGRNGPGLLAAELDIFEGYASAPKTFHGALHRNTGSRHGVPDEIRAIAPSVDDLTASFHTYAALWTQDEVVWYLDGVELGRAPVFDSTDQEMFVILDMWIDPQLGVDESTPEELHLEVDRVSVWQAPHAQRGRTRD